MSKQHDNEEIREHDLEEQAHEEAEVYEAEHDIANESGEVPEIEEEDDEAPTSENAKLKDMLARNTADFENFKKRTERDKQDMIFFLKSDIYKTILPRLDDLTRIIDNTPEESRDTPLYEGIVTLRKTLVKDLKKQGVESFESKGESVDPEKHEVMTQVPGEEGVIIDEFEPGYMLGDKVLRVAKVVVGNGS